MSDLVFTTQGQAETLAAQEAIAKKGREIRDEFEQGAKSVGAWDAQMSKLKSSAESALRSVKTEQEKIAEQIERIKEAQAKGMVPPAEAEAAVARLKERWVEADEATRKQADDADKAAQAHKQLKESAERAISSVATEGEKAQKHIEELEQEVENIQAAMKEGLVPQDVGETAVQRLKAEMESLKKPMEEVEHGGDRIKHAIEHLFDPVILIKGAGAFVGIHAAIHLVKNELEDIQARVDKRIAAQMKPAERLEQLKQNEENAREEQQRAEATAMSVRRMAGQEATAYDEQLADIDRRKAQREKAAYDRVDKFNQANEALDENEKQSKVQRDREAKDDLDRIAEARREFYQHPSIKNKEAIAKAAEQARRNEENFKFNSDQAANRRAQLADDERRAGEQDELQLKEEQRQRESLKQPGLVSASIAEADANLKEANDKLAAAVGLRSDFEGRPGTRRSQRIKNRRKAIEEFKDDLANLGDENELPSEEIAMVQEGLQQAGMGVLARKLDGLGKKDDLKGAIDSFRGVKQSNLEEIRRGTRLVDPGYSSEITPYTKEEIEHFRRSAEASEKVVAILERIYNESKGVEPLMNRPE